MNLDDAEAKAEQRSMVLAACDDALASESSIETSGATAAPKDVHTSLAEDVAWCRLVRRLLTGIPTKESSLDRPASLSSLPLANSRHETAVVEPGATRATLPLAKLGRFQIRRELGRGGCGVVFLAYDPKLGREVALKVPRPEAILYPELRARFAQEARAAASLDHPNLVPVYEAGDEGAICYIASAYCPGITLSAWLRNRTGPVPFDVAARLLATVAEAVDHAHRRGILHRDLKPGNIMLSPLTSEGRETRDEGRASATRDGDEQGLDFVPRVMDFGLAKLLEGEPGANAAGYQTQSGAIVGTPNYMAPEQASGQNKSVCPATDVYALGAILYEVLTGQPPFQADSIVNTLMLVRTQEPVTPARMRFDVPRDLETICLKALAKEPGRRYASAGEFGDDLRRYLRHEPIRARRIGPLGRLTRWCRRNPALAATLFLALLTITLVAGFSFLRVVEERNRARRLAADLALDKGISLCEQEEVGAGLLWMVRAMELSPADDADFHAAIHANLGAWGKAVVPLKAIVQLPCKSSNPAVSPNGRHVFFAGQGIGQCLDLLSGQFSGPPFQYGEEPTAYGVGNDGRVWIGLHSGAIRAWDPSSGKALGPLIQHGERVLGLGADPQGKWIVAAGEKKVQRYDAASGAAIGPSSHGVVASKNQITFSPKGTLLLAHTPDHARQVVDAATGKTLVVLPVEATFTAVHPDERLIAAAFPDEVRFWDPATKDFTGSPLARNKPTSGLSFSPDGKLVLTGSIDRTAQLWDVVTRKKLYEPFHHAEPVRFAAIGQDGRTLMTMSGQQTVYLWELPSSDKPRFLYHPGPVWSAALSNDGKTLLVGAGTNYGAGSAHLWDIDAGTERIPPLQHVTKVFTVAISPDGKTLFTGAHRDDPYLHSWDAATGCKRASSPSLKEGWCALAVSPDGRWLMGGRYTNNGAQRFHAQTCLPDDVPFPHEQPVRSIAISNDGQLVLTGGYDKKARLWNLDGQPSGEPIHNQGEIGAVALSSDKRWAMIGSDYRVAEIWNLETRALVGPPLQHRGTIRAVAIHPEGKLVLTGSGDKTARLWDAKTGKPVGPAIRHDAEIEVALFAPDGRSIITGGRDKVVRIHPMPPSVHGTSERLRAWIEVATALELDPAGNVRSLGPDDWRKRCQLLEQLGGPLP